MDTAWDSASKDKRHFRPSDVSGIPMQNVTALKKFVEHILKHREIPRILSETLGQPKISVIGGGLAL